ncbi:MULTISPECIES: penicillin-binding protein 2 [unclassified Nocardioides]|uniref:penicillin-binding protein 2 n=1 Tax=unclassified Nocardioides TaxID=2615069 RepID=UPI0006FDE4D5|nr:MULTISPECIES: penicillin-binding protein 2 [unclassified Nocardioides]KRA39368.1 penicillin-binding protein 2 [Nocardioides sp. Root614]KRA93333.1 penicillin-binding protein 2 [Nocardioides sp. Root682]
MAATPGGASHRSRLRLIVIQTLVFSLLATLGARLYYLQVISGEQYQGQAASQSVREIVVQPQRGLVVDAMGRPLVTNRLTWVVSLDRTLLGKMSEADRTELLRRTGKAIRMRVSAIQAKLLLCGDSGAIAGECWNGSPFQALPVALDVKESAALRILEQPEDFPGVVVDRQSVRQYPSPYGVNAAHLLGYVSPITKDELDEAEDAGDSSVNGASVVGRAGVEKEYDEWLRGQPGYQQVAVDSRGRVREDVSDLEARPGDTLVSTIDARVQGIVETQLAKMIKTQRNTLDPVTKRKFEADSGAAIVMEAKTGRIIAMASQPTYDPGVWVGGITDKQLERLYSEAAGTPLLSRAFQGQFAPGSTWKPFMTVGALTNGFSRDTVLPCSSAVQIGNRAFHNHESHAYGSIGFAQAIAVSCNTFFFQVGMKFWQQFGSDPDDVNARDPLVEEAEAFGFGDQTGVDLPGEASGRVADRKWKLAYYKSMKDYYCGIAAKPQTKKTSDFVYKFSREFCVEGWKYRLPDAANFAIGQGDTIVTPLQLARGYAAISNGGTLWQPRVAKAIVSPEGEVIREIAPKKDRTVKIPPKVLKYLDDALKGVALPGGTMAWKLGGFPIDKVKIRAKTGSAEVYGKQSTGWVASYTKDYVVVMMMTQGGTGSGSTGDGVRAIWEALYGVDGEKVRPDKAAIPGVTPPAALPTFAEDGSILPPARKERP